MEKLSGCNTPGMKPLAKRSQQFKQMLALYQRVRNGDVFRFQHVLVLVVVPTQLKQTAQWKVVELVKHSSSHLSLASPLSTVILGT